MQIVIEIDDKLYEIIKNPKKLETMYHAGRLCKAVNSGKVLPKGHGRLIDENKLLENLRESANHHANNSREEALLRRDRDIIRALPPVTPQEPKIGHWIYRTSDDYLGELNRYYECSECGRTVGDTVGDIYTEYPYCHCGAKMVKDGEK